MFFEKHNLLSKAEFGFRKSQSMVGAVQHDVENCLDTFENKEKVDFTLFDLTKAFYYIPYDILFSKLEVYGIRNCSLLTSLSHS